MGSEPLEAYAAEGGDDLAALRRATALAELATIAMRDPEIA